MAAAAGKRVPKTVVRRSAIHGSGVFANRAIRKGERIIEYRGERISVEEGERRYPVPDEGVHHTFLFTLDEGVLVDGGSRGNSARLINHSCEPNAESLIDGNHIWIYARRPIRKGEEITYDYHMEVPGRVTKADRLQYPCECGAKRCRGTLIDIKRAKKRKR